MMEANHCGNIQSVVGGDMSSFVIKEAVVVSRRVNIFLHTTGSGETVRI